MRTEFDIVGVSYFLPREKNTKSLLTNCANSVCLNDCLKQIIIGSNRKYICNGPPAFKSQTVGYQSNQKLLHHSRHAKNQLNS